jgi:hypothetical protein
MANDALPNRSVAESDIFRGRQIEQNSMDELPEELIANIGSRLSFDVLANLSRTSKRYQRIANSCLYYEAAEELREHVNERYRQGNLKALVKYPGLATHVRELILDFSYRYHLDDDEDDNENGDEASMNTASMTVLHNAVNIQKLAIQDDGDYRIEGPQPSKPHYWLDLFGVVTSTAKVQLSQAFEHLNHLDIKGDTIRLFELGPIFRLPGLKSLKLSNVMKHGPLRDWIIPASTCSIQELEPYDCNLDSVLVPQIVACLRALTCFIYDHRRSPSEAEAAFSWSVIGDALRGHANTIRAVQLYNIMDPGYQTQTTLGFIKECQALRHLNIPLHNINSLEQDPIHLSECLPSNLESIFTYIDHESINITHCAETIRSVKTLTPTGTDLEITCVILKGAPYAKLGLSSALTTLEDAGIKIHPIRLMTGEEGNERFVSLHTLREIEADGYEDYSTECSEDDEDENEDEDVDEGEDSEEDDKEEAENEE